ncbi:MAG: hypothetical protein ACYC6T_10155 [Thermoleophilia bacterium]
MNTIRRTVLAVLVALALVLAMAPVAFAGEQEGPVVKVAGEVQITQDGTKVFAAFEAKSTGPSAAGMDHQPAEGVLTYRDANGLRFQVSVEHIHAHSANEVHFGGVIVKANDPSLIGMHAHMVAVDNGKQDDRFSVLLTAAGTHEHAPPVLVERGELVVKVR